MHTIKYYHEQHTVYLLVGVLRTLKSHTHCEPHQPGPMESEKLPHVLANTTHISRVCDSILHSTSSAHAILTRGFLSVKMLYLLRVSLRQL